jgi:putative membrane protein
MWTFVVGFRNMLAGNPHDRELIFLRTGDQPVGAAVVLTSVSYMLLASLAMGIAEALGSWRPRGGSVIGTIGSSLPPLIALTATIASIASAPVERFTVRYVSR